MKSAFRVLFSSTNRGKTPDKAVRQTKDGWLYRERYLIECFFQKLKWFRRIATRYDKLDASFLAFIYLTTIAILLI